MADSRPARRTGRPPLTDRATLLAAAREIGFPALTVGAVTARVGVKYSTFYRHFPSLEALVTALADELFGEVSFPEPTESWPEHMVATCTVLFDLLAAHPGLAAAMVKLPDAPHAVVEAYRNLSDALLGAGFAPEDAVMGATAALELVVHPWLTITDRGAGAVRWRHQARDAPEPLDPRARAVIQDLVDDPPRRWTLRKVELLIEGLESRLARTDTPVKPD